MKVVVIGPGRIGMAVARCAKIAGHEVDLLGRAGSDSLSAARAEGFSIFTRAAAKNWKLVDVMIFAAAPENAHRFQRPDAVKDAFDDLAACSAGVPLASVAGAVTLEMIKEIFGHRPAARFFCSAAVANPASARFYDASSDVIALALLKETLPSEHWNCIPSEDFRRYGAMLTAAALACVPLIKIAQLIGPLTQQESRFLLGTLDEARRLIEANSNDPAAAFFSALTPGGLTETFSQRIYQHPPTLGGNNTDLAEDEI